MIEFKQIGDFMDWFKKHTDTVIILGGILSSFMWMNHKFNEIDQRFVALEKDVTIIKTVMLMQGHLPKELATQSQ